MQDHYNLTQINSSREAVLATNKLIRNTYALLSMTLLFSAMTASFAVTSGAAPVNPFISLAVMIGTLFALHKSQNSVWCLPLVFFFTGFLGYTAGPIISFYLTLSNGGEIVTTALALTGIMFLGLSSYALISQRDFSFMRGFLLIGLLLIIVASLANIFLAIPALQLTISAVGVLVFSGLILFDTSRMIHGGEQNYVMVTVGLYLSIYNLFMMLLHLVGAFNNSD
jgi:modulator of FtsH protease